MAGFPPPAYGDPNTRPAYGPGYGQPAPQGYPGAQAPAFTVPGAYPQAWPAGTAVPVSDRPPREQCFFIKNMSLNQIVEVEGSRVDPGTRVVTGKAKPKPQAVDSQLWFEDLATGTIKSRLNLLCLDLKDCSPGFQLVRSAGMPVAKAVCLSKQNDGGGPHQSVVAHTQWGTIPGKAKGKTCWYAYGGQEHVTSDFSWIVASEVANVPNTGVPPVGAMAVGHMTDGSGIQYAAIAKTSHGTIPGRGQGNVCHYPYGGREHVTSDFDWLVAEQSYSVVNPYIPGNPNQLWVRSGDRIQCRQDGNKVLQVSGKGVGSQVTAWANTGTAQQLWAFPSPAPEKQGTPGPAFGVPQPRAPPAGAVHVPPAPQAQHQKSTARKLEDVMEAFAEKMAIEVAKRTAGRKFVIRSQMHSKVLDVKAGNKAPGTMAILWPRKQPGPNQLWHQDPEGIIRSDLTNFALQPSGHGIWLQPYQGKDNQKWIFSGNKIVSKSTPGRCLEVHSSNQANGTGVCMAQYKGTANQHWVVDYV